MSAGAETELARQSFAIAFRSSEASPEATAAELRRRAEAVAAHIAEHPQEGSALLPERTVLIEELAELILSGADLSSCLGEAVSACLQILALTDWARKTMACCCLEEIFRRHGELLLLRGRPTDEEAAPRPEARASAQSEGELNLGDLATQAGDAGSAGEPSSAPSADQPSSPLLEQALAALLESLKSEKRETRDCAARALAALPPGLQDRAIRSAAEPFPETLGRLDGLVMLAGLVLAARPSAPAVSVLSQASSFQSSDEGNMEYLQTRLCNALSNAVSRRLWALSNGAGSKSFAASLTQRGSSRLSASQAALQSQDPIQEEELSAARAMISRTRESSRPKVREAGARVVAGLALLRGILESCSYVSLAQELSGVSGVLPKQLVLVPVDGAKEAREEKAAESKETGETTEAAQSADGSAETGNNAKSETRARANACGYYSLCLQQLCIAATTPFSNPAENSVTFHQGEASARSAAAPASVRVNALIASGLGGSGLEASGRMAVSSRGSSSAQEGPDSQQEIQKAVQVFSRRLTDMYAHMHNLFRALRSEYPHHPDAYSPLALGMTYLVASNLVSRGGAEPEGILYNVIHSLLLKGSATVAEAAIASLRVAEDLGVRMQNKRALFDQLLAFAYHKSSPVSTGARAWLNSVYSSWVNEAAGRLGGDRYLALYRRCKRSGEEWKAWGLRISEIIRKLFSRLGNSDYEYVEAALNALHAVLVLAAENVRERGIEREEGQEGHAAGLFALDFPKYALLLADKASGALTTLFELSAAGQAGSDAAMVREGNQAVLRGSMRVLASLCRLADAQGKFGEGRLIQELHAARPGFIPALVEHLLDEDGVCANASAYFVGAASCALCGPLGEALGAEQVGEAENDVGKEEKCDAEAAETTDTAAQEPPKPKSLPELLARATAIALLYAFNTEVDEMAEKHLLALPCLVHSLSLCPRAAFLAVCGSLAAPELDWVREELNLRDTVVQLCRCRADDPAAPAPESTPLAAAWDLATAAFVAVAAHADGEEENNDASSAPASGAELEQDFLAGKTPERSRKSVEAARAYLKSPSPERLQCLCNELFPEEPDLQGALEVMLLLSPSGELLPEPVRGDKESNVFRH